jgi:hypothetical protein
VNLCQQSAGWPWRKRGFSFPLVPEYCTQSPSHKRGHGCRPQVYIAVVPARLGFDVELMVLWLPTGLGSGLCVLPGRIAANPRIKL